MEYKKIDIVFDINRILEQSSAMAALLAATKDPYTARPTRIDLENTATLIPFALESIMEATSRLMGYAEGLDLGSARDTGLVTFTISLPESVPAPVVTMVRIALEQAVAAHILYLLYAGDEAAAEEQRRMRELFRQNISRALAPLALY
ncbi:MAG: hypothetical protein PUD64_10230 [Bacteroidales bacterium]|nr:hypothetical protein [Bacteroidales bacterium]